MVHVPHMRLTLQGELPDGEMFSCNLSLRVEGQTAADWLGWFSGEEILVNRWPDLVTDCTDFWARPLSYISQRAILKLVKLAPIDELGHYSGPAMEMAVNQAGGINDQGDATQMFPHQIARKITLETDGDLGRVKGGFYLPGVTRQGWDVTTNLTSVAVVTDIRDSVKTFIDALNDAPGIDNTGSFKVVIASQGRTRQGVQTVPPTLFDVERVNVGRRVDVQRRRANKLAEARIADADVT